MISGVVRTQRSNGRGALGVALLNILPRQTALRPDRDLKLRRAKRWLFALSQVKKSCIEALVDAETGHHY